MAQQKIDMAKILAMLAQPRETPPPLENVERRRYDIPYITKDRKVESRPFQLILPTGVTRPIPLIFVAHYEMTEDARELRSYLEKGWAVASAYEFNDEYNAELTDDDLVFNNAALYKMRNLPEIDRKRIAVVGSSAGGYTSLMLSALQLGICCSIANAPITNLYYNVNLYFNETRRVNNQALEKISKGNREHVSDVEPGDLFSRLMNLKDLPLPFAAAVTGLFEPNLNNFPDPNDMTRWEALSPVGLAEMFCNPLMVNHFTSDALVPLDQVSRRFSYDRPGSSLPQDFNFSLPKELAGKLGYSLEERLPKEETRIVCMPALDADEDGVLPYDPDKRFNLNIYDEGPIEGYASHRIQAGTGTTDDRPYLEEMLSKTSAKTNVLTPDKLLLLLERYQGRSIQLPAHEGVDDEVYGSLNIYRREVVELLTEWKKDNGEKAWESVVSEMLDRQTDVVNREELEELLRLF